MRWRRGSRTRAGRPARWPCVVIDLDHLREINNRFGHLVGDRVILGVAEALASTGEPNATAARFGGEEFCLLLPGASLEEATLCAETVRERVASMRFRETDRVDDAASATLSAGVASFPEHGDTVEELIKAADHAVYEAKAAGRNRVRAALSAEARAALELTDAATTDQPALELLVPPAEAPEAAPYRPPIKGRTHPRGRSPGGASFPHMRRS